MYRFILFSSLYYLELHIHNPPPNLLQMSLFTHQQNMKQEQIQLK